MSNRTKNRVTPAAEPADEVLDLRDDADQKHSDTEPDEDDEPLDEDEEEAEEEAGQKPATNKGGRPRGSTGSMVATAVFKDELQYQDFLAEAQELKLSPSAYALRVMLNRHNTQDNLESWKEREQMLQDRVTALQGAKEVLQNMYEQAVRNGGDVGLGSLDTVTNAADIKRIVAKGIADGLAERDLKDKLARLEVVEKELKEAEEELEKADKYIEELEEQLLKGSNLDAKIQMYGPAVAQGLAKQFPGVIASLANSPLGSLAGLNPADFDMAGAPAALVADSLTLAVNNVRDNLSPRKCRDLESVLDFVAANPDALDRFTNYVQQVRNAASRPAAAPVAAPATAPQS